MSTINCKGTLINLSTPKVMGIVNVTPDSFFDGGKQEKGLCQGQRPQYPGKQGNVGDIEKREKPKRYGFHLWG